MRVLQCKPETMANRNPDFNVGQAYTPPVTQKIGARSMAKTVSIFDAEQTGI